MKGFRYYEALINASYTEYEAIKAFNEAANGPISTYELWLLENVCKRRIADIRKRKVA